MQNRQLPKRWEGEEGHKQMLAGAPKEDDRPECVALTRQRIEHTDQP